MLSEYKFQPHGDASSQRGYVQYASIDPAVKNYAVLVERVYDNGDVKTGLFEKHDLTGECPLDNLSQVLYDRMDYFNTCDHIVVEKQLKMNNVAKPMAQHTISVFLISLKGNERRTRLYEVDSRLKNMVIGKYKTYKGQSVKEISILYAEAELARRGDTYKLDILMKAKKKDDLADVVSQLDAVRLQLTR